MGSGWIERYRGRGSPGCHATYIVSTFVAERKPLIDHSRSRADILICECFLACWLRSASVGLGDPA